MKLKRVIKDLILLVLSKHELLKKISIAQDKIFVYKERFGEERMWIHHLKFQDFDLQNKNTEKIKKNEEPTLTLRAFIVSMTHYPDKENFNFLFLPFNNLLFSAK